MFLFPSLNTPSSFLLASGPSTDMYLWASSYEYQRTVWSTPPPRTPKDYRLLLWECWVGGGGGGSEKCTAKAEWPGVSQGSEARPNITLAKTAELT